MNGRTTMVALANQQACNFSAYGMKAVKTKKSNPIGYALAYARKPSVSLTVVDGYQTLMTKYARDGVFTEGHPNVVTKEWCEDEAYNLTKTYGSPLLALKVTRESFSRKW